MEIRIGSLQPSIAFNIFFDYRNTSSCFFTDFIGQKLTIFWLIITMYHYNLYFIIISILKKHEYFQLYQYIT